MQDHFDVAVVGAGAAGLAAARKLGSGPLTAMVLEARDRIGGRAHTFCANGLPLDAGAGWLHSADVNPLVRPIEALGFGVDRTRPHWERQSGNQDFPPEDQAAFRAAYAAFEERLEAAARAGRDRPASDFLEAGGRWNVLLNAVSSYYNGVEYDRVSVLDYGAYQDTGVNWRVREGYGAALAALGRGLEVVLGCPVTAIDHSADPIRLSTPRGLVSARCVILTVPTPHLTGRIDFRPALPAKAAAAEGAALGLADKVFLALQGAEELPVEGHLFGRTDRAETGSYHLRPFGRPYIEAFLGGRNALALEGEGPGAATAFVLEELAALMGSDFRKRLSPIAETAWAADEWSLGAYSAARPGEASCRAVLAQPVDGRLFFAGEATHPTAFSTVHGAWLSGERAAREVLATLGA